MSIKAMGWARDQQVGGGTTKLVLLLLADYSDDDGVCWPGIETVAEKAEVSEKSVRRHLKKLEDGGILTRTRRRRDDGTMGTYLYQLLIGPEPATSAQDAPAGRLTGGDGEEAEISASPTETPSPDSPPSETTTAQDLPAGKLTGGEDPAERPDHRSICPQPPDNGGSTTGQIVRAEPSVEQLVRPASSSAEGKSAQERSLEELLAGDHQPALEILRGLRGWSATVERTFLARYVTGPTGELLWKGVPEEHQAAVLAECVYQYVEAEGMDRWRGNRFMGWLRTAGKTARKNVARAQIAEPVGDPDAEGLQELEGGAVLLPDGRRLTKAQAEALRRTREKFAAAGAA